ncbi:MAG: LysM peptidoglycan-binding domain-containing protein [Actinomycetota bacterium]|nr:LysM peptidoglycan-binding domain-containing protein [Actinomycetota bacterium]
MLPGENLWEIAARTLRTDDVGRISHYWRRLYSHNRHVIGPNPNLIRPGEVIELPEQ